MRSRCRPGGQRDRMLPGTALAPYDRADDHRACRELQGRQGLPERDPARDQGNSRHEVDRQRRPARWQLGQRRVVQPESDEAHHDPEVRDARPPRGSRTRPGRRSRSQGSRKEEHPSDDRLHPREQPGAVWGAEVLENELRARRGHHRQEFEGVAESRIRGGTAPNPALGNTLELLAMVAAAGSQLVLKHLSSPYGPWLLTGMQAVVGGVFFLPGALASGPSTWSRATPAGWASVAYLGIMVSLVAFGLYNTALAKLPASRASLSINLVPAVALIAGWVALRETLTALQFAACAVIVGAVVWGESGPGEHAVPLPAGAAAGPHALRDRSRPIRPRRRSPRMPRTAGPSGSPGARPSPRSGQQPARG